MRMMMAVAAGMALAAGTVGAAERLRGFDALAAVSERVAVKGIGFGERGRFQVGAATGRFERSSARRGIGAERVGLATVRFALADGEATIAGACHADEAALRERPARNLTVTTTTSLPRLRCRFTVDGVPAGVLDLGEGPARGGAPHGERFGALRWGDRGFGVRSVHHFARTRIGAGSPLGYLIDNEEGAIAGVDTSGFGRVLLLPRGTDRTPALAAGAALALMWEPDAG